MCQGKTCAQCGSAETGVLAERDARPSVDGYIDRMEAVMRAAGERRCARCLRGAHRHAFRADADGVTPVVVCVSLGANCIDPAWEAAEGARFADALVMGALDGFRYERCGECGKDANRHTFSADMFGKPYIWCLDGGAE